MKKFWQLQLQQHYRDKANDGSGQGQGGGGGGSGADDVDDSSKTGGDDEGAGGNDDDAGGSGGGAKKPTDEEAKLLKENMKRKEEVQKLKEQLAEVSAIANVVKELGGIDTLKGMVASARDAETKKLEEKGEWTKLKEAMTAEHQRELKEAKDALAAIQSSKNELEGKIVDLTIGTQFAQSKFITDDLILTPSKARALYGSHFDFVDGTVVGYTAARGSADRSPIVDASGNPLPFDQAMAKIIDADPEKDHLLRAKGKSGSGSSTSRQTTTVVNDTAGMTGVERIALGLSRKK